MGSGSAHGSGPGCSRSEAGAGRTEETVALLERHPDADSGLLARHLIELGRVKDAVAVLQRRPEPPEDETFWAGTAGTLVDEPPF
ncbi:tetratricopeptide repeat protein [Streptosporangium sp. LJ11]|uniref:tetratricopeptide repeat protein n=1 Tax=Streptosporangium sp. LJ11 TaxID=3436927 RepID=UPI003F7ACF3B